MTVTLHIDDLEGHEIRALLAAHLAFARGHSPPESVHALDLDGLRAPDVTFWVAREAGALVACGALRELDAAHGEVKSMHTAAAARGRGHGAALLAHLLAEARQRGYRRVSLETGAMAAFAPARGLYARFGFTPCPPFGEYQEDPASVCMTLELDPEHPGRGGAVQGRSG